MRSVEPVSFARVMRHEPHDAGELLRQFVQGRDVPCPQCGYNLRNTESARCPECGTPLSLHVNAPRGFKLGATLWAILAAALPLGVYLTGLALLAFAVAEPMFRRNSSYHWTSLDVKAAALLGGASLFYALLLVVALRSHSLLARRRAAHRRLLVLGWVVALLATHAYLFRWFIAILNEM